jgi:type III restriction enzyme
MSSRTNTGTENIPLKFAKEFSILVNREWENGGFLHCVTDVTRDLLRYWFEISFCEERAKNFHEGQKQAVLNTIYAHEILKSDSVIDLYSKTANEMKNFLVNSAFLSLIQKDKYAHPKYCIKMATGTGKTWVLNAILIWQYLNAKYPAANSDVKYTKNFLLVAPGLIVYERLLDAFRGKQNEDGTRDFDTSDLKSNEELFLPEHYREDIYSFVQNAVTDKTEIGRKTTGDGIIAITNWHALNDAEEESENENDDKIETAGFDLNKSKEVANEILPLSPGTTQGNALETLDNNYLRGGLLEFLSNLPDICVFNDEAHHIHETKTNGIVSEVEWQNALNKISENKRRNFVQVDFSATPYDVTGNGERRTKHYFPHIVTDFDLSTAIRRGLVKTFVLDKRREIAALANKEIDFRARRNDNRSVIGLSDGQRLMLRAGLSKLKILEQNFENKYPKMLVICEDTKVSPLVVDFLKHENLDENDIIQIDSDRKGSIPQKDWDNVKQKLFALDKLQKPRIVVSVLMLREGFDVSNVCVIVPLRSSQAPILLEQVLGRGLRLMWREPEYADSKAENRKNIFELKKEPINYFDTLFVVEHPAFEKFYEDLDNDLIGEDSRENPDRENVLGDMIHVELKENYQDYDFFFPQIIKDKEEILNGSEISVEKMQPLTGWNLEQLKRMVPKDNDERFVSEEQSVKTQFGEYKVTGDIFTAQSYNEYLQKMLNTITTNLAKLGRSGHKTALPLMQIDQTLLVAAIDQFVRTKLFGQPFNPLENNNWRVLILSKTTIVEHVMRELSTAVYEMQTHIDASEAVVEKRYFSEVTTMAGRKNYSLNIVKSIYKKTFYPSNKGGLERKFLEAADADSQVERIIKINEHKHTFARFRYLRSDGMLSSYFPDFFVKIGGNIYVVETKGSHDADHPDVLSKKRGALDWIARINELNLDNRMNAEWSYALLTETNFDEFYRQKASIMAILEHSKLTREKTEGVLF